MGRFKFITILLIFWKFEADAQVSPFEIKLSPISVNGLGGLQSYAYGQYDGKWIIIGGRLDGLHRRQPFASFDVAGNNNKIIVVDVKKNLVWTSALSGLSVSLQEQLSSTNMEFHQEGDMLYLIGGYGYNAASASRKTFASMIAVNLKQLSDSVVSGKSITSAFRQYADQKFAVTGGHLESIGDIFYLLGGNRFDGNYNPMGNPTFTQVYTNSIRKFKIQDDGVNLNVIHIDEVIDTASFHRRDYNAVAQILPSGAEGITMFSGVFQLKTDLPFLNCVNIDSQSHQIQANFQQFYNHYHCPVLPVYAANSNKMNTVFFGGIAQFYDSLGVLVQDDNVPFVKTVARVERDANGNMYEYKMPLDMPDFLGASAEFIRNLDLDWYRNGVLNLDQVEADSILVGYIFGGISSTAKNIFFINNGTQSQASDRIYEVYLYKNANTGIDRLNTHSYSALGLQIYPNPSEGVFRLRFNLEQAVSVELNVLDVQGRLVYSGKIEDTQLGWNEVQVQLNDIMSGGTYFIELKTPSERIYRKLVLER